jgi:microsomal dipeptidase-like Zn-dependent dipeptidase
MSLFGYADLHCHPMAHLGFGGATIPISAVTRRLFWGLPDNARSATPDPVYCLPCCRPSHLFRQLLPILVDSHHGDGFPRFAWPRHDTVLHQQMYFEWMKRAWQGGLRLICALAVHNRLLASMFDYPPGTDLSDTAAIRAQLAEMKRFATRHGRWMEIVTTADQARASIVNGKLAVVLGIEVDSLGEWRAPQDTSLPKIEALLSSLYDDGVRTITPIHLANNAFGGCAISDDQFNLLNHFLGQNLRHRFYEVRRDRVPGVEYRLGTATGPQVMVNAYLELVRSRPRPDTVEMSYPNYPAMNPHCSANAEGLSPMGHLFLKAMMKRGMLIDTDHMSELARDEALTLAERYEYPVYSSHTALRDLALTRAEASPVTFAGVAHEGMLTLEQLIRLRNLGGVIAPMTNLGPTKAHRGLPTTPPRDERNSSLSWMNAYAYAVEKMEGKGGVALGTDFNGFAKQPGPRFRGDHVIGPSTRVLYPTASGLPEYRLGDRTFNFNEVGLAHYGLLPDFLVDADNVLPRDKQGENATATLFRSAEAFCVMWRRCEEQSRKLGNVV